MVTRAPRRRAGLTVAFAAMTLAVVGVAGVVAAPTVMNSTGLRTPNTASSTIDPSVLAPSASASAPTTTQPAGAPVIGPPAAADGRPLNGKTLQARLAALPRQQGGRASWLVLDATTGQQLSASGATAMMLPASNLKTLTSVAVLSLMGPDATLDTTVTSPKPGQLVLRGGGDPLLSCAGNPAWPGAASLATLAKSTAAAVKKQGLTSVTLGFDDSLYSGPAWHPTWPAGYADQTTAITALSCDEGMTLSPQGALTGPRSTTPSADAAARFAALLTANGVKVTGAPAKAKATGASVAKVSSWPLQQVVGWTMLHSDNFAAENLFRHVALASGQPASFAGGAKALQAELTTLKIWTPGAVTTDGSGLSRSDRVSASMLAKAWQVAASNPKLSGLLVSTPVAGVSGTLVDRFFIDEGGAPGRGWVHAKTGTLTGVSTLSGWTTTASGEPIIFAAMVNDSTNDWFARVWLDQVTSVVTACGC